MAPGSLHAPSEHQGLERCARKYGGVSAGGTVIRYSKCQHEGGGTCDSIVKKKNEGMVLEIQ